MPRFGEQPLTAAIVWALAARELTDIQLEEIVDLPAFDSSYPALAIASAASADGFGSWGEISADVGTGKRLLWGVLVRNDATAIAHCEIEFGEGESGSESAIASFSFPGAAIPTQGLEFTRIDLFRALTDNARLSARVRDSSVSGITYRVSWGIA
ncbi:hypothetical protein LCGC14_0778970 [marine sediment metagenome]|uniref:Uncharacterized protein n=1 Tax=marine sediment metagenome TaxID=412755 RepID=A0A0F9T359_9ZZZZ